MKWGGYQNLLTLILLVLFLSCPAYANMIIHPTVSRFFFEKDGLPYNQSVTFTVTCYRYLPSPQQHDQSWRSKIGNDSLEKVLSFSGTCRYYGCPHEDLTYYVKFHTDTCDLEGRTLGRPFIIRDFSNIPAGYCIDPFHQYDIRKGEMSNYSYYKISPEYSDCMAGIKPLKDKCRQYTTAYACSMNESSKCSEGYAYVGDEEVVYDDRNIYRECIAPFEKEKETCEHYLLPVAPSSLIMMSWNYTADRYCESRFTIPAYIETPVETPNWTRLNKYPAVTPYVSPTQYDTSLHNSEPEKEPSVRPSHPESPVATLYCSIVEFLGGRCE